MIISSLILTYNTDNRIETMKYTTNDIMTISEAAEYLRISEVNLKKIIIIEKNMLKIAGHFRGRMLPYYKIDDNYYFYKKGLDSWLEDVTTNKVMYDTYKNIRIK